MSEIHFHPGDATRPARTAHLSARTGALIAAALGAAGVLVVAGLFGAPDLLSDLIRSAERISLRESKKRGLEAFASVRRRHLKLATRVAADELFLARVATLSGLPLPDGFPGDAPGIEPAAGADPAVEVAALLRRVRELEAFRRRIASATKPLPAGLDPTRVPSRSPVEPTGAVPIVLFGPQISPLTRQEEFHPGLSLAASRGTVVLAPAGGTVVYAGPSPGRAGAAWRTLGTILVLAHDEKTRTVYGHLEKVLVKRRQRVGRGDAIARVGQTGWAAAPQLHYEVRRLVDGRFLPADPRLYMLDVDWLTAADVRSGPKAPPESDLPRQLR